VLPPRRGLLHRERHGSGGRRSRELDLGRGDGMGGGEETAALGGRGEEGFMGRDEGAIPLVCGCDD
jgi:hypothetical protein